MPVGHGETIHTEFSADSPAIQAFAVVAGLEAWKLAAAFSDPERLFDYLTLAELARFKVGIDLLESTRLEMQKAMDYYLAFTRGVIAGSTKDQ